VAARSHEVFTIRTDERRASWRRPKTAAVLLKPKKGMSTGRSHPLVLSILGKSRDFGWGLRGSESRI